MLLLAVDYGTLLIFTILALVVAGLFVAMRWQLRRVHVPDDDRLEAEAAAAEAELADAIEAQKGQSAKKDA